LWLGDQQDRIALLEYELGLSRDDIQALKHEVKQLHMRAAQRRKQGEEEEEEEMRDEMRDEMMQLVQWFLTCMHSDDDRQGLGSTTGAPREDQLDAPRPSEDERRHINCLIRHHLMECGYKMTAITFGEEVSALCDSPLPPAALCWLLIRRPFSVAMKAEEELEWLAGEEEQEVKQGRQSLTQLHRNFYNNPITERFKVTQARPPPPVH